jgi:hypothetical protein
LRILLDTGIALRFGIPGDPLYPHLRQALAHRASLGDTLILALQTLYEFWSVATRPKANNGYGLSPGDVAGEARQLATTFRLLYDPSTLVGT